MASKRNEGEIVGRGRCPLRSQQGSEDRQKGGVLISTFAAVGEKGGDKCSPMREALYGRKKSARIAAGNEKGIHLKCVQKTKKK